MPDAPRTTPIREVGTVLVPVTDLERALDFYVGTRFVIVQPG
jgi:hypothetical protein